MINAVFGKTMENIRKTKRHQACKLPKKQKNYLFSEPNFHTKKMVFRKVISNKNEKIKQIFMNKQSTNVSFLVSLHKTEIWGTSKNFAAQIQIAL